MKNKKLELDSPGVSSSLSKRIATDIDEYCKEFYNDGHRTHLGASLIGGECKRYLWYVFRWVKRADFKASLYRLFNRGHREEDRFIEWLEGIGVEVWADDLTNNKLWYHPESDSYLISPVADDIDPLCVDVSDNEHHIKRAKADGVQFPQYRISDINGHFGGSLDGIAKLPERYGIDEPVLLEFKTSGDKYFKKLVEKGMVVEKPQHFAQTSTYGLKYGFRYVLYLCINKNNDEMHVELVKLDHNLGRQMIMKAESIITSQEPPPRISNNATFFKCKFCDMNAICHTGELIEKNCRSCKNAVPGESKQWICNFYKSAIPKEKISEGCDNWKAITDKG